MSALEMQSFLARLYVDSSFRRLFTLEPEPLLDQYKLTSEERAALHQLSPDDVERFARGLLRKRRRKVSAAFPLLMDRLRHPEIDRLYVRYCALFPDDPSLAPLQQGQSFGRFMETSLAGDPDLPPYAGELARYERMLFAAMVEGGAPAAAGDPPPLLPETVPAVRPGVQWGSFQHDLVRIARALRAGEPVEAGTPGEYGLILFRKPGRRKPETLRASRETLDLLDLCDGERSFAQVVLAYERHAGESGLTAEIRLAVEDLCGQQVLALTRAGG